jgi:hypothetical protein
VRTMLETGHNAEFGSAAGRIAGVLLLLAGIVLAVGLCSASAPCP